MNNAISIFLQYSRDARIINESEVFAAAAGEFLLRLKECEFSQSLLVMTHALVVDRLRHADPEHFPAEFNGPICQPYFSPRMRFDPILNAEVELKKLVLHILREEERAVPGKNKKELLDKLAEQYGVSKELPYGYADALAFRPMGYSSW